MTSLISSLLCFFSLICACHSAHPGVDGLCALFNLDDDPIITNEFECTTNCVPDKSDSDLFNLNIKCTHPKNPSNSEIGIKFF